MKIIECPRDAMQGIEKFIPTEVKTKYIQELIEVGFDTIDFGSFVSPKAVPQMADTAEVLKGLDFSTSNSKLLAIVANERGAKEAIEFEEINYLGFPFSISAQFQQYNTNASQEEAVERIKRIQELCVTNRRQLVVYLSMAFGNPYGEEWSVEVVAPWVEQFAQLEIPILALSDTVGVAKPESISYLFKELILEFGQIEFGAHFHSLPNEWEEKVESALKAGCRRFDSTIHGLGGCPMAKNELVGNIATEQLLLYLAENQYDIEFIDQTELLEAIRLSNKVFETP